MASPVVSKGRLSGTSYQVHRPKGHGGRPAGSPAEWGRPCEHLLCGTSCQVHSCGHSAVGETGASSCEYLGWLRSKPARQRHQVGATQASCV